MRILIIRNYPSYFDLESKTYNIQEIGLAKSLSKNGIICDVLLWTDKEEKVVEVRGQSEEFIVKVFYKKGISVLKNLVFLGCNGLFDTYDILQVCEYNQIQSWMIAKKYPRKAIIFHGPYYASFNVKYNLMARLFDIFFLSDYIKLNTPIITKSFLAEDYLRKKNLNNITSVGVGLDIENLSEKNVSNNQFIDEIQSYKEDKILYIGKIEPRRNPLFLIDLLKEIRTHKKILLIVVGTGDKRYLKKFFNYAKRKGVAECILYYEKIEQNRISAIYNCAKAFVLPTLYDIFGMVTLEAMYFKKAVFTSFNGGSSMMIRNDENGFIINGFKVKEWADLIIKVIDNEKKMAEIGEKANVTVKELFTWDTLSKSFIDQYKKVTDSYK